MNATLTTRYGDKVRTRTSHRYVVVRPEVSGGRIIYRTDVLERALKKRDPYVDEVHDTVTKERVR